MGQKGEGMGEMAWVQGRRERRLRRKKGWGRIKGKRRE
jgi:hypothetical protein